MRPRVTLADVAREAQVSSQTVSRVLNNKGPMRPETRELVLQAVERLGYRPNSIARGLATNRTATLGLIVPDIGNPYFAEVVRGAEDAARDRGYHVFLCNTDQHPEREEDAVAALEGKWVDGIVLCNPRLPLDRLRALLNRSTGVVLVGYDPIDEAIGTVRVDDVTGAGMAIRHLVERGRRNLVFLSGQPGGPSHAHRLRGYLQAATDLGLSPDESRYVYCDSNASSGFEAAIEALEAFPAINGMLCFNDLVAIGALRACADRNRRIPDDVAVIGFDDILLASLVQPQLTTVYRPKRELGAAAIEMLLNHLDGIDQTREVILAADLAIRQSAP